MLSDGLRTSLKQAADRYHANVYEARSYLEARGIGETEALGHHLGKVSDPLPGHERFRGMLSIPYMCMDTVVALKFRRIDGSEGAKYDAPAGQKQRLYNAQSLADGGSLAVVCEGEFDAIVAQRVLGAPSVGVPGVAAWSANPHWSRCFGDFDRVVVIGDNDLKEDDSNPGMRHAQRVVKDLGHNAELVTPPPGHDMTSWYLTDGEEAIRRAVGV